MEYYSAVNKEERSCFPSSFSGFGRPTDAELQRHSKWDLIVVFQSWSVIFFLSKEYIFFTGKIHGMEISQVLFSLIILSNHLTFSKYNLIHFAGQTPFLVTRTQSKGNKAQTDIKSYLWFVE